MDTTVENPPDLSEVLAQNSSDSLNESFRIGSIEVAAWAARKVVAARHRIEERKAQAERFRAQIEAWLEKANREDNDSVAYLVSHLKPFARDEIAKQRRSRTLFLPGASLSLRKKPDRIEITDEAVLLSYCTERLPEALVVTTTISKSAIKAKILSGELPPAVEFIPGEDELYIASDTPVASQADFHAA